jgi:thiol-disulfide isomerase/thioredoxin
MAQIDPLDVDRWVHARLASLAPSQDWQPNPSIGLGKVYARRAAYSSRRRRWAGTAIAAAALFFFVPGARALGSRCVEACVSVTARAAQLWRVAEPEGALPREVGGAIGNFAPDLLGTDVHGSPVQLSSFRGHVILVNFWATWCAPCRSEIPLLNDLDARFGSKGLDVIGVSLDEDGWGAVGPFVIQEHMAYRVGLGSEAVTAAYGSVTALPMTFIIDREGRIVVKHLGAAADGDFDAQIAQFLAR